MKSLLRVYNMCYSVYNLTNTSNCCNFLVRQKLPLPLFFRLRSVSGSLPKVSYGQDLDLNSGLCSLKAYTMGFSGNMELGLEEQGILAVVEGHSRSVTESGLRAGVPAVARQGTRRWQRAGRRQGGCKERPGSRGSDQEDLSLVGGAEGLRERTPGEAREGEPVLAEGTSF